MAASQPGGVGQVRCWADIRGDIVVFTLGEASSGQVQPRPPVSPEVSRAMPGRSGVLIHAVGGVGLNQIGGCIDVLNIHAYVKQIDVPRLAYVATDVRQLTAFMRVAKAWGLHGRASYFNHMADALEYLGCASVRAVMTA